MMVSPPAQRVFAAEAGDICWFEWGDPADIPVLLLHATGFHARCWDQVIARLPSGVRVIAPDLRGHGRSFKPDSIEDWSLIADDIMQLVESLDLRETVAAGHSLGGNCLIRIAGQKPDRFGALVLVDPVAFPPKNYENPPQRHGTDPAKHPTARRRNRWESAEQLFDHLTDRSPFSLWDKSVLRDYCGFALLPSGEAGWLELACPPMVEASAYMGGAHANVHSFLPAIQCPVTVMRAQLRARDDIVDFTNSPTYPKLAGLFAKGEDMFLPHLSHFIAMQDPALVADTLATAITMVRGGPDAGKQG